MVRSPCYENSSLRKGPWTAEEDEKLVAFIQENGYGSWRSLPFKAGLQRCGKSCRLRWTNYLRPDIKRGKFSLQEEQTIIQLHALLGNRWSTIATHLPNRTDNEIKNYWNTNLRKRLTKMGIDPITHKPQHLALNRRQSKEIANISHMAQWESARLQAEARLVQESNLVSNYLRTDVSPPPQPPALMPRPPCLDVLKVWEWTNPGKDISSMILNGFLPFKGEDMIPNSTVGFSEGASSFENYENPSSKYEGNGIMGSSMELDNPIRHSTYVDQDSLGFPSFTDGLDFPAISNNALGACWGAGEENKGDCRSNMGSTMFLN